MKRVAGVALVAVLAIPVLLLFTGGGGSSGGMSPVGCQVDVDTAGEVTELTDPKQVENARTIIAVGQQLKIPARGLIVAIATAMQESTLQNLDHGDRDSVGLFQQRDAWGSFEDRTTPAVSAHMFFTGGRGGQRGLLDIDGWQLMTIAGAAQAVQVSAFPAAYARWEGLATNVVAQVTSGKTSQQVCANPNMSTPDPSQDLSGKYQNGRIPIAALAALRWAPAHYLRADAAAASEQLAAAYEVGMGAKLCVTDSYRDYDTQVRLYATKPNLAAKPGTSNHGWGVAMDLCGGIQNFGTPAHQWMKANAPRFGWIHPSWAEPSGSRPEPWHWSFGVE